MSVKPIKQISVACGKYQKDGEEKTRWHNIGTLFKDEDTGRYSVKLEALPIFTADNEGWLQCFDIKKKEARQDEGGEVPF